MVLSDKEVVSICHLRKAPNVSSKLKQTIKTMNEELKKQEEDSFTYHFFFNHGIYDELKHYEDLINETELFLTTKVIAMESSTDEEIIDERFGKKIQYEGIFPMILWKSLFLSTYFLLENSLDQICKNLRKSNSYNLTLKDISGNGIFRSSLYLKKVCNIKEPFGSQTWTEVNDFNKIRNVFVHSDGIISKSATETIKVCEKYNQIQLNEYDEDNFSIQIDSEFCKYSLTKIEKLINEVHTGMRKERSSH